MPPERPNPAVHVLVMHDGSDAFRSRLEGLDRRFLIEQRPAADREAIASLDDPDVEVLLASFAPRDLRRTPKLRWLQLESAGVDHLLADAPWNMGLIVTNARGVFAAAVGQYVLAEVLRINQRIDERRALQLRHAWATGEEHDRVTGRLAHDQTALIIGYGGIGREVARLLRTIGMRVLAAKHQPEILADRAYCLAGTGDPDGSIPERVVGTDDLAAVVPLADLVVLTMPLTDRSRGLFGDRLLRAMRPDAWLINTGRGAVVDEAALARGLTERRIGGAVLDVFATEPLPPESPFWDAPNTVVTPHVSGGDIGSDHILADLFALNLERYARGAPLLNVVDPDLQY